MNLRTVIVAEVDETLVLVEISSVVGDFTSDMLPVFKDIKEVDISGCKEIDPDEFVQNILQVQKLQKIVLTGCSQFQEYHLVEFLPYMDCLQDVQIRGCDFMSSEIVVELLENMCSIVHFDFDPRHFNADIQCWQYIEQKWDSVSFGIGFLKFFEESVIDGDVTLSSEE